MERAIEIVGGLKAPVSARGRGFYVRGPRVHDPLPSLVNLIRDFGPVKRGALLTRWLLTFSRRQAVEPQVLDVHAVVRAFEPILQRLTLDVVLRLRTEGPAPMARVEPGQIEQIVMNLVVNARDALPEDGTIDVLVDTMEVGRGGEAKYFEIRPGRYGRIAV